MGDGIIHVNSAEVAVFAENLAKGTHAIGEILSRLDAQVASLRGDWTGSASNAYEKAHSQWTSELDAMNRVLADAGRATKQADDDFLATEHENRRRWK